MSEAQRPRSLGRSVGALFAGFVAVVILSIGTDVALHAAGIFPPLGKPMSDGLLRWRPSIAVALVGGSSAWS